MEGVHFFRPISDSSAIELKSATATDTQTKVERPGVMTGTNDLFICALTVWPHLCSTIQPSQMCDNQHSLSSQPKRDRQSEAGFMTMQQIRMICVTQTVPIIYFILELAQEV